MGRFKTSRRSITGRRAKGTDRPTPAGAGITEKETTMLLKLNLRTGELVEDQSDTAAPTAVEVEGLARIKRALSSGALTVDDLIPDSLLADDAADAGKPNRGNGTMTTELHDEHVKEWKRHQAAKAAPMRDVQNHIKMYFHCAKCLDEHPGAESYTPNLEVGWTPKGLQVWCAHHRCNSVAFDY